MRYDFSGDGELSGAGERGSLTGICQLLCGEHEPRGGRNDLHGRLISCMLTCMNTYRMVKMDTVKAHTHTHTGAMAFNAGSRPPRISDISDQQFHDICSSV